MFVLFSYQKVNLNGHIDKPKIYHFDEEYLKV